jgi:hypothetical protein
LDFFIAIFFNRRVKDQNINKMVKELDNAESVLIQTATLSGAAKNENNLPKTMNKGAPGGCPTSNLYAAVIYSPQSQRLAVDSMVIK